MSEIRVDTISEKTSANGVAIDGLTIKDGGITATTGAIVFNEASADVDFRVESNGQANMLFVDGGNNRVHVNGTTGTRELNVSGDNTRLLLYSTNNSTGAGQLQFGDDGNEQIGRIMYEHDGNQMSFHTNNVQRLLIDSAGFFDVASTGNDIARFSGPNSGGLTIRNATANEVIVHTGTSDALIFGTAGNNERMKIDGSGHVTMPAQPAVLAYSSSAQNDIATGVVTINLDAEVYDVNADFNTSNYTFTAPVTGKYMCSGQIVMNDVDTAFQWIYGRFNTSNRLYYMALIDPRIEMSADGTHTWTFSALVDMDANDTLKLDTRSSAHGAAQNNITAGTATALETFMTVYLAV